MKHAHFPPPERSGLYRTPPSVEALRAAAADAGAAWFDADLARVEDKQGLLEALADACGFPASFGANWDALADSLQDLSWRPARGYVVQLLHAERAAARLGVHWSTLLEILNEAATYWKARGKTCLVLVDRAVELPAWS